MVQSCSVLSLLRIWTSVSFRLTYEPNHNRYLTLALGFLFRWTWIKQLAPVVGAAKLYAGAVSSSCECRVLIWMQYYMTMNLTDAENSPAVPWLFVAQSSSYMVIPLLLILRMWNVDQPFKTTTTKPKKK